MQPGRIAAVAFGCSLVAGPLVAQRFEAGLGVGLALPLREFKVGAKLGLEEMVSFKLQPGEAPVAIRLDVTRAEFRGRAAPTFVYPRTR